MNLYGGVIAGGSTPALVHVSTAYVAGVQKGVIPEGPLDHRVDYRLELDLAMGARHDVEVAFTQAGDAERVPGRRPQGARTSRAVDRGRVTPRNAGRSGSRSVWSSTDARARGPSAGQTSTPSPRRWANGPWRISPPEANLPLSIVRPSIIESAYTHPFPGWIDGFKMADPIIRAYGLGQIPEFPGIAEGIIDIIPVDFVVNAILAVAANPPPPGEAAHYNVSSGSRNPLRFFELYEWVRGYFEEHPLPERGRGRAQGPRLEVPRQPHRGAHAAARRAPDRRRRAGRHAHAQIQSDARLGTPRRPRQGARGLREAIQRPVRHVHRDRGRLHGRPHVRAVRLAEGR